MKESSKGTIFGYCRISTRKQSLERQVRNIQSRFPDAVIVQEAFTGTTMNRQRWNCLVQKVKRDDTIVFDSVSRMSRNADEGWRVYESLFDKGVNLVFLKEPHIDTAVYQSALEDKLSMTGSEVDVILSAINVYLKTLAKKQIQLAFEQSEKEVADLHARVREGLVTARLNGKTLGNPKGKKLNIKKAVVAKEQIFRYCKTFEGTLKDEDVIRLIGIAHNTFYKYKKELRAERFGKREE